MSKSHGKCYIEAEVWSYEDIRDDKTAETYVRDIISSAGYKLVMLYGSILIQDEWTEVTAGPGDYVVKIADDVDVYSDEALSEVKIAFAVSGG